MRELSGTNPLVFFPAFKTLSVSRHIFGADVGNVGVLSDAESFDICGAFKPVVG